MRRTSSFLTALLLTGPLIVTSLRAEPDGLAPDNPSMHGYGYFTTMVDPYPWTIGNVFTVVCIADPGDLTIVPFDEIANEYTIVLQNAEVVGIQNYGDWSLVEFGPGLGFAAYEDSKSTGTAADYGLTAPPNGFAPDTFDDGSLMAQTSLDIDDFIVEVNRVTGTGHFALAGGFPIVNCALLGPFFDDFFHVVGNLAFEKPTGEFPEPMPAPGYEFRIFANSDCDSPLQSNEATWGRLKSNYR